MARRIVWLGFLCALVFLFAPGAAAQSGDTEPQPMGDIRDRLAAPPVSDPPTLVESGHTEYYLYCMVCHGDRGQGLTKEWRNAGDPADANCWQSRCHASNHPPGGFVLPRYAPPLIGNYALARFATIGDLHQYIQLSMPWHIPGFLKDEQYRRIAVYLADANGVAGLRSGLDWAEIAARAPTSRTPVVQAVVSEEKMSNQSWIRALLSLVGAVLVVSGVVWARRGRR